MRILKLPLAGLLFCVMALFAGCKTSNEPKAPVALTWEMGASDIEPGYYENTFILKNISQKPLKKNWTIYYWAYWMVWCVAAPFFIGSISRGRTVRQTILGGYVFGVGSTLTSFIVLGNYSMGMQVTGKADFIAQYLESGDLYGMIVSIIKTMPGAPVIMVVVLLTMIAFYATSFDSIALTASCYSYHTLEDGEQPNKGIQLMWCILLILLPIALLFAESSMNNLQSVSIVAAFPIGAVIVMIAVSFMKDAKKYMESLEESAKKNNWKNT